MVPEYHSCLFRRIIVLCKLQEICQSLCFSHTCRRLLIHQLQSFAAVQPSLQVVCIDHIILPLGRSTRLNDHIYIFRKLHLHKLTQIIGGKSTTRFQITSTEIPVDRPASLFCFGNSIRRLPVCRLLFVTGCQSTPHHQNHEYCQKPLFHSHSSHVNSDSHQLLFLC